ncbi:MAG: ArsR/SmtB family transcription factor [Chthoniobacterales bacterium]
MVNNPAHPLDSIFAALADPTRRGILELLARAECRVAELARPFSISPPAVSRHLRVLERAGLIKRSRDGRVHRMTLDSEPMREAAAWIEQYRKFWEGQFDSLARYLEQQPPKKKKP